MVADTKTTRKTFKPKTNRVISTCRKDSPESSCQPPTASPARSISFLIVVFAVSGCESLMPHPRAWTKREKIAAGFFIAAHTLNACSTENHQDYPNYYETNPIMGRHPSDTEIVTYFSITGIGALLIAHWYPELREPLLYSYGGLNLGLAVNDFKMVENRR